VPHGSDLDGQDGEQIQSQCQNPTPDNWYAAGTVQHYGDVPKASKKPKNKKLPKHLRTSE
jgi:hypothetical protein